jgi:hypothetical protein
MEAQVDGTRPLQQRIYSVTAGGGRGAKTVEKIESRPFPFV